MESIKNSFIGHQGRCFDVRYSESGKEVLSASEDGTARLWDVEKKRSIFTFDHDKSNEVLRCSFLDGTKDHVCTCGSDGNALIWSLKGDSSFDKSMILRHGDSQIYACEIFPCFTSAHVLTAADNEIYIWDLSGGGNESPCTAYAFETNTPATEDTFGGRNRNPDRKAYVFDAKPSTSSMLVAVALSDGTVRLLDLRCRDTALCLEASLPPDLHGSTSQIHSTAVCWAPNESSVVASLGNGDVSVLDIRTGNKQAYLHGAHAKSCFGAAFSKGSNACNDGHQMFATWASDGSIRIWDLSSISGLTSKEQSCKKEIFLPDYAVYSAATSTATANDELLVGGGSGSNSFMGTLVHTISAFT